MSAIRSVPPCKR